MSKIDKKGGIITNLRYLGEFLTNPVQTGSITPSSQSLAMQICLLANLKKKLSIVELGPGTGVFTKEIDKQRNPTSTYFAIEINSEFAELTRGNVPNVTVYEGSASNIAIYLQKHGKDTTDCIISGIPRASLPILDQINLLETLLGSMSQGGVFLTFTYVHALSLSTSKHFYKLLQSKFSSVKKSDIIWDNIPPALVYICIK